SFQFARFEWCAVCAKDEDAITTIANKFKPREEVFISRQLCHEFGFAWRDLTCAATERTRTTS
ncbi:hypothetical protein ABTN31_19435, partial [Acinetobacter baumannii]